MKGNKACRSVGKLLYAVIVPWIYEYIYVYISAACLSIYFGIFHFLDIFTIFFIGLPFLKLIWIWNASLGKFLGHIEILLLCLSLELRKLRNMISIYYYSILLRLEKLAEGGILWMHGMLCTLRACSDCGMIFYTCLSLAFPI